MAIKMSFAGQTIHKPGIYGPTTPIVIDPTQEYLHRRDMEHGNNPNPTINQIYAMLHFLEFKLKVKVMKKTNQYVLENDLLAK